ncbi:MAG: ABC transporter permease [Firmicutes bacterium]|nr:ABC transporter permease [Bacillota bacterium]MBR6504068.1 ABC transporter permease [Bacillota bacterium]
MAIYIVKRLAAAVATILVIMAITFFLMNTIPGSPFLTEKSTPQQIELANQKYGLDKPLIVQFKNYIVNYAHGDLGVSLKMQEGTPVKKILFGQGKFVLSIKLGVCALLVAICLGIPLGCLAAYKRGTWIDGLLRVLTTVGVAIPTFVLASTLLVAFAVKLNWLPTLSGSLDSWKAYIMPVISLSFYDVCYIAKLTRTSMLDAINQDYIRTAKAKGVKNKWIVLKHALRNSLIPVITFLGPLAAFIITGSFVVETIFSVPGLGKYFIQSVINRDYTIIMATTVVVSVLVIVMNLVVDIAYKIVDPRITLSSTDE